MNDLIKKLLHIDDTPERTALAYSIGVFLAFSPFLGFHTLAGLAIAFLFNLNRVAVLLGVWSNTPWWIVPYYVMATWVGMWMTGFWIDWATLKGIFQFGMDNKSKGLDFFIHQLNLHLIFCFDDMSRWIKFWSSTIWS
jgi:hypothetical protein